MRTGLRPRPTASVPIASRLRHGGALLSLVLCLCTGCGDQPAAEPPGGGAPGSAAAEGGAPTAEVPADAPLVVVLGDSIAAGLHLDADDAFPAVLRRRLADEGLPIRLVNAGVSGDTTAGGLSRIDWLLKQEPDVVLVELGGNDGLRGQPLASVEANLRGILERVRAAGARALLLGMDVPTSYGADYADGFRALYPRVAGDLDVPLVPYFLEGVGAVPEMNLPDGIHPTPAGHERLAENVLPYLMPLIEAAYAEAGSVTPGSGE